MNCFYNLIAKIKLKFKKLNDQDKQRFLKALNMMKKSTSNLSYEEQSKSLFYIKD